MLDNQYPWVGDQDDNSVKPEPISPTFEEVLVERRSLLKTVAAAAAAPLFAAAVTSQAAQAAETETNEAFFGSSNGIEFDPIRPIRGGSQDFIDVPSNYNVSLVIRWGDPVVPGAPEFDWNTQTAAKQAQQFGYNNDYLGFFPGTDWRSQNSGVGILAVNHEYTNEELMFRGYNPANTTREQVDIAIAAHGMSFIEVQRMPDAWIYNPNSSFNRRITGETVCEITGPAAGDEWMRTSYDPTGTRVRGTLNNCAGGKTPWGTVLTSEENFNQYFANAGRETNAAKLADHRRLGIPTAASPRRWEAFHDRFDVAREPNEIFRFGWNVEIDPYNPTAAPKKRTALGRFKHECATTILSRDNRCVVYSGDDERFDYVYKFVTEGRVDMNNRAANMDLLDRGTLYVARYNADGTGVWLPLIFGQGPLTAANGWRSQADVLIRCRTAADALGATRMDRPEDVEANPVTGKVYILCTNNTNRGVGNNPGVDAANPRPANRWGHIVEMTESAGDNAALTFRWDLFMVCGDPNNPAHRTFWGGWQGTVSPIGAPDNCVFDNFGNIWIATDGMDSALGFNDALYACPTEGPERGRLRMFMGFPNGSEFCGPEFTPDNTTVFGAVQHPGEGAVLGAERPVSLWPDGRTGPRPAVVAVIKASGTGSNRIGSR